jgi:hypothetical protein
MITEQQMDRAEGQQMDSRRTAGQHKDKRKDNRNNRWTQTGPTTKRESHINIE